MHNDLYNFKMNPNGHLFNFNDWCFFVAIVIAKAENINLTKNHVVVVLLIRNLYSKRRRPPAIKDIIESVKGKVKKNNFNSISLYKLFPEGPIRQAAKIAGIPEPIYCI